MQETESYKVSCLLPEFLDLELNVRPVHKHFDIMGDEQYAAATLLTDRILPRVIATFAGDGGANIFKAPQSNRRT